MIIIPPPLIIHRPGRYRSMSIEQIDRRIAMIDRMQKETDSFIKTICLVIIGVPTIAVVGYFICNYFWG